MLFAEAVDYAQSLTRQQTTLTWNGFRVYAIDGTKKNLPLSEELEEYFEVPPRAHFPQMITGVLFDVLAKLPINYMRAPFNTPEREMALALIQELGPGDLLVLDRGYPGYRMFQAIIKQRLDFLIRLPKRFGIFWPQADGTVKLLFTLLKLCSKPTPKPIISP
ncbi:MAG: transposase [Deltaproteobacteria bacterium]|nr:transposase [Deltaproteobacteria bacterium]